MGWDAASTGGTAAIGVLGFPWIPLLAWLAALACIGLAVHFARGGKARGPAGVVARLRGSGGSSTPLRWMVHGLASAAFLLPGLVYNVWLRDWDPLSWSEPGGPGPQVADIRSDGWWQSDTIENESSWSWSPGEPCLSGCSGPRYVYRLSPGDSYTFQSTVRNDGPVRIRLLGRPERDGPPPPYGLALLRDPASASADPRNLRPFEPVDLAPGDTVTIAIVETAPTCADPAADVPPNGRAGSSLAGPTMTGYVLVYEVLGWRREGTIWPHFSISVAGCEEASI